IPYIPIAGFQQEFSDFLESFLPPSTSEFFFKSIFENIQGNQQAGLLSSVFILSLLLMANGVNAVFSGFENSYHEQLTRNVFKQYLYALGVALILAVLLIVTVAVIGYFEIYIIPNVFETLENQGLAKADHGTVWITIAKYLFYVVMVYIATAVLYYFGTREGRNTRFFSIGALLTTVLFLLTSFLFGVYIENFSKYNELYGSIGALLILLFYMWLNSNILLLGFELNASLNKLRSRF
ncbi:MAG TPA: YihY/virulence factor BrkB family protein, partial [Flavobacteriaceae bacterium]|nr:YihY/virulence factor BrkB family protein [Flavobacteriaceae bacterium]